MPFTPLQEERGEDAAVACCRTLVEPLTFAVFVRMVDAATKSGLQQALDDISKATVLQGFGCRCVTPAILDLAAIELPRARRGHYKMRC